ncbi:hypothetical protein ANCCAN_14180 [Ancylostoma caninum]|uniref:Uncharacterized protein n=1 Tax=Ancylostoma caninum TaxID=29170 RepID=A0A368GA81_ANCCA|nr:hypothetical protein ANCCAN_14180 [Ancylostoma caninum]
MEARKMDVHHRGHNEVRLLSAHRLYESKILNRESSPVRDDIPFNFTDNIDKDDFDPAAALNISAHSNG